MQLCKAGLGWIALYQLGYKKELWETSQDEDVHFHPCILHPLAEELHFSSGLAVGPCRRSLLFVTWQLKVEVFFYISCKSCNQKGLLKINFWQSKDIIIIYFFLATRMHLCWFCIAESRNKPNNSPKISCTERQFTCVSVWLHSFWHLQSQFIWVKLCRIRD